MIHSFFIAWRILIHSPRRLGLSLCGMAFATLIMFLEMGFYNGLADSQAMLATLIDGDLIMLHAERVSLMFNDRFDPIRLAMAAADEDVAEVVPFYEGTTTLRNPQSLQSRSIYALAFPPGARALRLPDVNAYESRLTTPGAILYDRRSRYIYGAVKADTTVALGDNRPHRVVGLVDIGPNFGQDGYLVMSGGTWKGLGNDEAVSLGLIRARPGVDLDSLQARLDAKLPDDMLIMTPEALRQREVAFTRNATPSGILLATGMMLGMVIGVMICYQILFNTIHDHLSQYATLKAIGFTDGFLARVVIHKALLLSLLGYAPGLLVSAALYALIEARTSIIMDLAPGRMLIILPLTVIMCAAAGLFAVRVVMKTDPAQLY